MREFDVAILGGGPAGAAIALQLINRGYSTVVIERSDYRGVRIGETLPPAVQPLLVTLGVWDQFRAQQHSPSFAIRSAWGQSEPYQNDFIFNPYGAGWHIDRVRFDAMLVRSAEEAGTAVYRDACVRSLDNDKRGKWKVEITHRDQLHSISAKLLVDATGRTSYASRKQGARRIASDHLIGVVSFFSLQSQQSSIDSSTLIEAAEGGWWYSAVLPNFGLVLAYMTDADLYAKACRDSRHCWSQQLATTKHTRALIENYSLTSGPRIVPANSSRLDRVTNGKWVAIGDAAMAFDPLSGQGIFKALESALYVADSVDCYLRGDARALTEYAITVEQDFSRYLLTLQTFYSKEKRWPDSLFWQRRISNPTFKQHYQQT